jgi:hypothetical protein
MWSLLLLSKKIFLEDIREKSMKNHKPQKGRRRDDLRYQLFAEAYLDISNRNTYLKAMQSALKAGYSESYAKHHSYKLVDQRGVQGWMRRIRNARLRHSTIATPEEILETLTQQLRTLPNELVDENGVPIPLNKLSRDQSQAIAGFKFKRRTIPQGEEAPIIEDTVEYKLTDRLVSAEKLAKYHGLFDRDNRQKAPALLQALVAFPTGEMSLEEWQKQATVILKTQEKEERINGWAPEPGSQLRS